MANRIYGAAAEVAARVLGGVISTPERVVQVTSSITEIVGIDPERVGLLLINLSANNVYISTTANPGASNGIFLAPNGGSISLNVNDDYTFQTNRFNGYAGSNSNVHVVEIRRVAEVEVS